MKHLLIAIVFLVSTAALADGWNGKWTGEGMVSSSAHGTLQCPEVLFETAQTDTELTVHMKKVCGDGEGQVTHEHTATFVVAHGTLSNADGKVVGTITDNTIHVSEVGSESSHNCIAVMTGAHVKLESSHTHGHNAGHFSAFLTAAE